jgi:uncharacterized Ntn-hydrolase superfamily protein
MAGVLASGGCGRAAPAPAPVERTSTLDMTTWSVVAVDPATGDVGVAMASCVPDTYGDGVAALVPGKGAAAIQAAWDLTNRNRVYEALQEGLSASEVIARVAEPSVDERLSSRQYGVVTIGDGEAEVAGYTGDGMKGTRSDERGPRWAGIRADAGMGVSAQGNTLESADVVAKPLAAFQWTDPAGFNTLPDRLMRAIEAGSIAGGDVRCNRDGHRQTAATAVILVARGGDEPYAAADINVTDQGTDAAPWLAISVTDSLGGANPLLELRRRYDAWRSQQSTEEGGGR